MATHEQAHEKLAADLVALKAKLPSPWVSTAASAATAIGMTVLSNGSVSMATDVPGLIVGEIKRHLVKS